MRLRGWYVAFVLMSLVMLLVALKFARWTVAGQIIDAETGMPIEGAVVAISWHKIGSGPPGLAGTEDVENEEAISGVQGSFEVPKYSTLFGKKFEMVIYRKGYVCWHSKYIFPSYEKRKDFRLRDGMKISLEPFKEQYSREDHARFTVFAPHFFSRLFDKAIEHESKLLSEIMRRYREK